MKTNAWDYLREAFNARPLGMWVPPNWVGVAAFGILGAVHPGFWILGAGLELGYLFALFNNSRFRRYVSGTQLAEAHEQSRQQLDATLRELDTPDQRRYRELESRCQLILEIQRKSGLTGALDTQAEGLGRLLWIYLRLLRTRQALHGMLQDSVDLDGNGLQERMTRLQRQIHGDKVREELRKSLQGQAEILQQRLEKQREAREKLVFLEAELTRIEQQVELLREQAMLAHDPEALSHRIDEVAGTLGGTTQWIQEQQQLVGTMEDLLAKPLPVPLRPVLREVQ